MDIRRELAKIKASAMAWQWDEQKYGFVKSGIYA